MNNYHENFPSSPNDMFDEQVEEEETLLDQCECSECKGTFYLSSGEEAEYCPLCNVKFDGLGGS